MHGMIHSGLLEWGRGGVLEEAVRKLLRNRPMHGGIVGAGTVCYVFIYNEKQIHCVSKAAPRPSFRPALTD